MKVYTNSDRRILRQYATGCTKLPFIYATNLVGAMRWSLDPLCARGALPRDWSAKNLKEIE